LEDNVQNDENANWRLGENGRVYVEKEHVFLYNKLLKINLKREKTELMENEKKKGNLILETIINLLKNAGRKLVIHGMNYEKVYGTLGLIALALVAIKVFTFYSLMGIKSNFIIIAFITLLFIYLLFSAFKNKWIPACIFAALSILMFADVTYNSFFNRYLSVGMLGAAGVVDDIGESIKEVMRPVNFIMLADAVFILVMLAKRKKSGNDKDVKKGSFNVLYNAYKCESFSSLVNNHKDDLFFIFSGIFSQISENYKEIKMQFNSDLVTNVLTRGIPKTTSNILLKGTKND